VAKKEKEKSTLERLFPAGEIVYENTRVVMKPMSLAQLPMVVNLFEKFEELRAQQKSDMEIVKEALTDILSVVGPCLDMPLEDIPAAMAPDIALCFIQQNFGPDVVGKWRALGSEMAALVPSSQGKAS
jgi:hypothetical protein